MQHVTNSDTFLEEIKKIMKKVPHSLYTVYGCLLCPYLVSNWPLFIQMSLPAPLAVDVGCGSGQGTVLLAPYFDKVVGMDISPAQLQNAQANQTCPNISYRQCPAEQLPFENGTVDLVTAMTAAHWFDRPRFLEEAYRVLKPGGCLTLLSYTLDMDVEYGDVSEKLKEVCKEVRTYLASQKY
uniref:Si:ch211-93g23.2 n=1 Tax=Neogobius melanostomus TaxID=47308 RepID=A0A8C6WVM6_9GOBI